MLQRAVKYVRWRAFALAAVGLLVMGVGVASVVSSLGNFALASLVILIGAVIVHIARLRLKESDTLLILTPDRIWTKELGWQAWGNLLVILHETGGMDTLEIRRPEDFTPRFFERVSTLNIHAHELRQWIKRFSIQKSSL